MKKILTAMGNEVLNRELRKYEQYDLEEDDLFYQEAVFEKLRLTKYDVLLVSGLLQGESEVMEFLTKVRNKYKVIRIILVTDDVTNSLKRQAADLGIVDVFSDSTVTFDDIIDSINREEPIIKACENKKLENYISQRSEQPNVVNEEMKREYVTTQKQEVIAVAGTNGSGKSTIAANFAKVLSRKTSSKILLIDLDTLNGNIDEILDINKIPQNVKLSIDENKKCGLNYAVELINKNRFDANVFEELVIHVGNVDVLTGNTSLHYCQNVLCEEHYRKIVDCAKEKYDFIIIDTTSNIFVDSAKWTLQKASKVLFVTEGNYLSMKKTTQLLNVFTRNWGVWKEKIKVIVNKETVESLGIDVVAQILEEYEVVGSIKHMEENLEYSYTKILEGINYIPKTTIISKILMMKNFKDFTGKSALSANV